jgi:hypothetical protein
MNLLILGDSHAVALGVGYQNLSAGGAGDAPKVRVAKLFSSPMSLESFHLEAPDRVSLTNPEASTALHQVLGRDHFSILDADKIFAFSLGFTPQVFLSRDDWTRFAPWNSGGAPAKSLVSDGVIRAMIVDHFKHVEAFLRSLRRLELRCIAVGAPPLMDRDHWVADAMSSDAVLAVDRLVRATMVDRFAKLDVPSVAPPPETFSGEGSTGFRRPEFKGSGKSGGHGDAIYGKLMLARVLETAAALGKGQASP